MGKRKYNPTISWNVAILVAVILMVSALLIIKKPILTISDIQLLQQCTEGEDGFVGNINMSNGEIWYSCWVIDDCDLLEVRELSKPFYLAKMQNCSLIVKDIHMIKNNGRWVTEILQ